VLSITHKKTALLALGGFFRVNGPVKEGL
jgi:hypothetical protein